MQIVLAILSLGLLGLIIYFAVSPKSSRLLKLAALIALGLIGLSIGICGFFLIKGPAPSKELIPLPVFQDASPKPVKNNNTIIALVFLLVLLLVLGGTVYFSLKGQRKKGAEQKKPEVSPAFHEDNTPEEQVIDDIDDNDESFDIETD